MAKTPVELPVEIHALIIEQAWLEQRNSTTAGPSTLANLSLVCKSFCAVAQPFIYREVHIGSVVRAKELQKLERVEQLGSCIKSLKLVGPPESDNRADENDEDDLSWWDLRDVLQPVSGKLSLTELWAIRIWTVPNAIDGLTLRTLVLWDVLAPCKFLKTLGRNTLPLLHALHLDKLYDESTQEPSIWSSLLNATTVPSLRELGWGDVRRTSGDSLALSDLDPVLLAQISTLYLVEPDHEPYVDLPLALTNLHALSIPFLTFLRSETPLPPSLTALHCYLDGPHLVKPAQVERFVAGFPPPPSQSLQTLVLNSIWQRRPRRCKPWLHWAAKSGIKVVYRSAEPTTGPRQLYRTEPQDTRPGFMDPESEPEE